MKKESEDQLLANNYYFANGGTTLCTYTGCQGFNFINYLLIKCKFIKNGKMMRGDLLPEVGSLAKCLLIKFKHFNIFSCVLFLRHRREKKRIMIIYRDNTKESEKKKWNDYNCPSAINPFTWFLHILSFNAEHPSVKTIFYMNINFYTTVARKTNNFPFSEYNIIKYFGK